MVLKRHALDVLCHLLLQERDARGSESVRLERVLQVLETVDEEDVLVPSTRHCGLLAQVGHALAHFHSGVDRRVQELCKVRLALMRVHERRVVHGNDLAQDLARVAQCKWRRQVCVWGLIELGSCSRGIMQQLTCRKRSSERPCAWRVPKKAASA